MVKLVSTGRPGTRRKTTPRVSTEGWRRVRPVIYFDRGSSKLRPIYRNQLKLLAKRLIKAADRRPILLEGHANPQESERQTVSLSRKRAEAVAGALRLFGLPRDRLKIVPIGSHERGRNAATARLPAWNRRVVILRPPRPSASAVSGLPKPPRRLRAVAAVAIG